MAKVGEVNYNNFGSKMEVINYRKFNDIDVYFEEYNWVFYNAQYDNFLKGSLKCPYEPRVCGKGYIGEGKYKSRVNGKKTDIYIEWIMMLNRCYSDDLHKEHNTYLNCEMYEEWHNFQKFAEWRENNFYQVGNEKMCLDKDILVKGNKIYSPETCIFVPDRINKLFTKSDKARGEYPIGVNYSKKYNDLRVRCSVFNIDKNKKERIHIGTFKPNQVEEAFQCYKTFKENYIKQVADDYYSKGLIPKKLYDAMYRYKIEITD